MRYFSFFLLVVVILGSCKKDEVQPTSSNSTGSATTSAPKVKSIRIQNYSGGDLSSISNVSLLYNSTGQLDTYQLIDSIANQQSWQVDYLTWNYSYTPFNKVKSIHLLWAFGDFTVQYIYDANSKLISEVWNTMTDTIHYFYSGNLIIREMQTSGTLSRDYYSQNLDSTITFNNQSLSQRIVYKHNSKIDKTNQYMNRFYDVVNHKHELESETRTAVSGNVSTTLTYISTRTYLANGNTSEIVVKQNSEIQSISRYTYF